MPAGGKAEWLAGRLRQAIADGRLAVGSRLPPTRVLAAELRVSRGVITEAYRRLAEDGHLEGRRRGGTVVVAAPFASGGGGVRGDVPKGTTVPRADGTASGGAPGKPRHGTQGGPLDHLSRSGSPGTPGLPGAHATGTAPPRAPRTRTPGNTPPGTSAARGPGSVPPGSSDAPSYGGSATSPPARPSRYLPPGAPVSPVSPASPASPFSRTPGPDVFDMLREAPAGVDLTPGRPDLAAFPRTAWLRAERAVLAELSAEHFGYGDPRGAPALRRAVAGWLARMRGVRVEPDEVLIVAGTAQALTLLRQVLRADGVDAVAVEDPGSLGGRQHLRNGGLDTPPVPVDEDGVRVDALRATGARVVLLTPAHQFPTGVVTSGERRRELLGWAADGGLILEDDYDAEHRYDRPPVPALRALLADRVCYMGSVSKLLAPALRIGWLVAPARYREELVDAKRFDDLGNAVLPQLVLARLMESGGLERQLRLLRRRHRDRRDAMIAALAEHLPGGTVHGAAAGLHLTVTYPADVPDTEVAAAALAHGVKCQPLSWHRQLPGPPGLVLGYAATAPGAVAEGVALLGRVLRELA
ncbi:aminotransferase-like domain-containing protein [Streptomyces sp. NBC_00557]|uniref:aminotransferase-like domain-containing protein n=1 Tax=Streptomyces sp. NBC_00557 TaxID=2975776 RepID=UPI002E807660|nr:aminotransferase class I/II-fold pyridoxal phosphate-dependent enzyme [Streptomyces sp. NBC_00557]WUC39799.1 aminotransferase class I/II-fold pyridoxal phosphate-dependent enzyme [Streptomyces sp. NBC_00557]